MKKQIKNYENYLIDDQGNVYNTNTNKILTGSIGEHGYKYYRLSKNGQKKMFYAHRLVAEAFIPNPNNLEIVNHKDGNKLNNSIDNLEWVSQSDNMKHWHSVLLPKRRTTIKYYTTNLENEEWLEYKNYCVSSCGRIRHKTKNNLLKPAITCGYYKVRLSENGLVEDWMVHKLVYILFTKDNDLDGYIIDHIDGNKLNNCISNLRKITPSENVNAALYTTKTNSSAKEVYQFDLNNNLIKKYPSIREAARELNLDSSTISKVCRGINKTHGGFIFKYNLE